MEAQTPRLWQVVVRDDVTLRRRRRKAMQNRAKTKIILALLIGSLTASQSRPADLPLMAEATTNFEPARKPRTEPGQPQAPAPAPVAPAKSETPPATGSAAPASAATAAVASAPAAAAPASVASPEAARVAQEEVIRRQAAQTQARAWIDEAQKLYSDGKYDAAIPKLESALRMLPRAKATESDVSRATRLLVDSCDRLALSSYQANDLASAKTYAQKALEYDPRDRAAENMLVKIKQGPPPPPPPNKSPEFMNAREQVRQLFREGRLLMNSGQLDEADKRFQQILVIDPYNADAYEYINQVTAKREDSTFAGMEANRNRMLSDADRGWLPPISGEVKPPQKPEAPERLPVTTSKILKKLNEIIFPEVKFRDAAITDVVQYLSDESRKLDPSGEGVNIVLGAGVRTGEAPPPAPATPAEAAPAAAAPAAGGVRTVTLSLLNVPMIDVLNFATSLAGLKYRVEPSAVLIVRLDEPEAVMITKTYPITPGAFARIATTAEAGAQQQQQRSGGEEFVRLGGARAEAATVDVRALFESAGISFPTGSSIIYNERTSMLIVKNTPENIENLERILPAFVDIPKQIEIEAKFVEISQTDLDELGFNWKVGSYRSGDTILEGGTPSTLFPSGSPNPGNSDEITSGLRDSTAISGNAIDALLGAAGVGSGANSIGTIRGILTNPQFELVIKALAQKKSADVLSAPKVTTISGVQAQIRVVQEFIYPTEFSEPQVGASGITPSIPSSFRTREVGVVLNVTPTVGADNYTINLTLIPEVSEFLGFLDYSPGSVTSTTTNNVQISTPFRIQQPLFSSRNVTTSVVLWDGQTVVLGGLIREEVQTVKDKVPFLGDIPFLGRLFRSEVSSRGKRNLLIFVTARLIDPAGNPIHKEPVQASLAR
jgi:general secretion pathway protein D